MPRPKLYSSHELCCVFRVKGFDTSAVLNDPAIVGFVYDACEWACAIYGLKVNATSCCLAVLSELNRGSNDIRAMLTELRRASYVEFPSVFSASLMVFHTAVVKLCQAEINRVIEAGIPCEMTSSPSTSIAAPIAPIQAASAV
jgi:hypothetical protein